VQTPNGEASGLDPEVLHTSTMVELSRWHSLFIAQGYLTTNILRRSWWPDAIFTNHSREPDSLGQDSFRDTRLTRCPTKESSPFRTREVLIITLSLIRADMRHCWTLLDMGSSVCFA